VVKGAEGADRVADGAAWRDVAEAPAVVALGVRSKGEEPLCSPSAGVEDDGGGKERDLGGVDGHNDRASCLECAGGLVGVKMSGRGDGPPLLHGRSRRRALCKLGVIVGETAKGNGMDNDFSSVRGRLEG
jgi:hypothetical protein